MRTVTIRAWGPRALFTAPHFRADPYNLPMIPPSAALGLLRSIYWKPEFEWEIDSIHLLAPIRYMTMRRRAVKTSRDNADRTVQTLTMLMDVNYLIVARVIENPLRPRPGSHLAEFRDRARKGRVRRTPSFGMVEYEARWSLVEDDIPRPIPLSRRLGRFPLNLFPLDLGVGDHRSTPDQFESVFFDAALELGILRVPEAPWAQRRARTFAVRNRAHPHHPGAVPEEANHVS